MEHIHFAFKGTSFYEGRKRGMTKINVIRGMRLKEKMLNKRMNETHFLFSHISDAGGGALDNMECLTLLAAHLITDQSLKLINTNV